MAQLILLGIFLKVISFIQCLPIVDEAIPGTKDTSGPKPPADSASFINKVPWGPSDVGTELHSANQKQAIPSQGNKDANDISGVPHQIVDPNGWVPPVDIGNAVDDGQAVNINSNNPFGLPHQSMDPHGLGPAIDIGNTLGDGNIDPNNPFGIQQQAMDAHGLGTPIDIRTAVGDGHASNIDPNNPFGLPRQATDPHGWGPPTDIVHAMGDGHAGSKDTSNPSGISQQILDPHGWGPPIDMGQVVSDGHVGSVDANAPGGSQHQIMDPHGWGPPIEMVKAVGDGHAVDSGEAVDMSKMVGSSFDTNPFNNPWLAGLESPFFKFGTEPVASDGTSQGDKKGSKNNAITLGQEINNKPEMSHQLLDLPNTMVAGQGIQFPGEILHHNSDVLNPGVTSKENGASSGMSHQIIDIPNMMIGDPKDFSWGQPANLQNHGVHDQNNVDSNQQHDIVHIDHNQQHNVDHVVPINPKLVHNNGNQVNNIPYTAPHVDKQSGKRETTTCKNDNKVDQFLQSLISDTSVIMDISPSQDAKSAGVSDVNYVADKPVRVPEIVQGSNISNKDKAVDITGNALDSAHGNPNDFWMKNLDTTLTGVQGPAMGPPVPFPPVPFESTTTSAPYVDTHTAVDSHKGSSGHNANTELHGHGGHHVLNDRKCEGVVKDSNGKITHIVDKHDCSLLPVVDSIVTGGHVIDPHNNELLLAVDSKSFIHPDNTGVHPHDVQHHPDIDVRNHPDIDVRNHPDVNVPRHPDIDVRNHPDINVPHHPDVNVPRHPDIDVRNHPDIYVPHHPDIDVPRHPDIGALPIVPVEKGPITETKVNIIASKDVKTPPNQNYEPVSADRKSGFTASELEDQLQQINIREKKQRLLEQQRKKQEEQEKRELARQKAREEKAKLREQQRQRAREEKARLREQQRKQKQKEERILARQKAREEKARLREQQRKQKQRKLAMQEKRRRLKEKKRRQKQKKLEAQEKRRQQRRLRKEERARKKAERRAKAREERKRKRKEEKMKKRQKEAARRKKERELERKTQALKKRAQKAADKNAQVLRSEVTSDSPSVLDFLKQRQQTKQEMLRHYQG